MLFNSGIFLKAFLPLVILFSLLIQKHFARLLPWFLIAISLLFYAWWKPSYLIILICSAGINFLLGRLIHKNDSKFLLGLGILFNLSLLGYFKYLGWIMEGLNTSGINWFSPKIYVLPLAISFYTFEQISYLIDCRKGIVKPATLRDYLFFVTFFPKLIAGPIVRFAELSRQISHIRITSENFGVGLTLFVIGLSKKVLFADQAATFVSPIFDAAKAGVTPIFIDAWIGALSYTLQIYFDFSGYSDMAIGLSLIFGIRLPINFYSPYKSTSIIEFWRRWHMTLSRFLRDYLYFPLGGSKHGEARRYINLILVMTIAGLWHGAGLTFVIWGLLNGLYLVINHLFRKVIKQSRQVTFIQQAISWVLTFLCIVIAWVFFRAENLSSANKMLMGMLGQGTQEILNGTHLTAGITIAILLPLAILFPNSNQIIGLVRLAPDAATEMLIPNNSRQSWIQWEPKALWAIAIGVLLLTQLVSTSKYSPFIYFQF